MRLSIAIFLVILGLLAPVVAKASDENNQVIIFAAASLRNVLESLFQSFEDETGIDVAVSYASSGILARQIAQGAPANIYLSANEKWADWLAEKIDMSDNKPFLSNRLVLITNKQKMKPIYLDERLSNSLIESKLAMGDFNHVPAGIYAKEALVNLKIWQFVKDHIAQTMDVRTTILLVERGEAIAGIAYRTDAHASDKLRIVDIFPKGSHQPIIYKAILITENATPAARLVFDKLRSPEVFNIYKKFGFNISKIE